LSDGKRNRVDRGAGMSEKVIVEIEDIRGLRAAVSGVEKPEPRRSASNGNGSLASGRKHPQQPGTHDIGAAHHARNRTGQA